MLLINLGCGFNHYEGYVNVDIREECDPDILLDVEKGLFWKDNEVDEIKSIDFLEHIRQDNVIFVLSEIHRVLKSEGVFHFMVPSTEGAGAFMDPSHRSYWNIASWLYFLHPEWHRLYPSWPFFKVVKQIRNVRTMPEINLIHVEGTISPVKG